MAALLLALPAHAQSSPTTCLSSPTAACVLALATEAARDEPQAGDRLLSFARIAHAHARIGDTEAISSLLAEAGTGPRRDQILVALAQARLLRGDLQGAIETARSVATGFLRTPVYAEIAVRMMESGQRAEARALAVGLARTQEADGVAHLLLSAALAQQDFAQAEAVLDLMTPDAAAWSQAEIVAALREAGDAAGASSRARALAAAGDGVQALRVLVAAGLTEEAVRLFDRLAATAAVGLEDAVSALLAYPGPQVLADHALSVAESDAPALRSAGVIFARRGAVEAAWRAVDRLAAIADSETSNRDAAAEAYGIVLGAIADRQVEEGAISLALGTLELAASRAYVPLDNPFPDPLPLRRVTILAGAGNLEGALVALERVWDPFDRAEALVAVAAMPASDPAMDIELLTAAATRVEEVAEIPTGFGGMMDATHRVIGALTRIAGMAHQLESELADPLSERAVQRILNVRGASRRADFLAEIAAVLP